MSNGEGRDCLGMPLSRRGLSWSGTSLFQTSPPILSLHSPLTPEDGSVPPGCLQRAQQLNAHECLNLKSGWLVLLVNKIKLGHQIGVPLCLTLIPPPLKLPLWLAVSRDPLPGHPRSFLLAVRKGEKNPGSKPAYSLPQLAV